MIEFDAAKDRANIEKHGVSLSRAEEMDLADAVIVRSDRDGERRFVAYGRLDDGRVHALVFTFRGADVRAISLRPASAKERRVFDR